MDNNYWQILLNQHFVDLRLLHATTILMLNLQSMPWKIGKKYQFKVMRTENTAFHDKYALKSVRLWEHPD